MYLSAKIPEKRHAVYPEIPALAGGGMAYRWFGREGLSVHGNGEGGFSAFPAQAGAFADAAPPASGPPQGANLPV
ncbi:hypothetical protein AGMMS49991_09020 [Spirochaetia bacterium]|nr:hypothetical protein AGMMS49991_09020 [Spirochaetia bacterium]